MYALEPSACANLLRSSRSTVVLTGAGISTAAGIPDFRGPKGLYVTRRYDPELVFEVYNFQRSPEYFYEFTRDFATAVKNIVPTFTHTFLAKLEKNSLLDGIVTQNIDILHQVAGSRNVLEIHGSYRTATCQECRARLHELDYDWWLTAMDASRNPPVAHCPTCDGLLKPDIVFFGESVSGYGEAEAMMVKCDLLLVLGSSLNVTPASLLPYSVPSTATTVVVNRGGVMLPPDPKRFFVDEDLDTYFKQVAKYLPV